MNKRSFLSLELVLLFFLIPVILFLEVLPIIKIGSLLIAITYVIVTSIKNKLIPLKSLLSFSLKNEWRALLLSCIIVLSSSLIFMYFWHPENLFIVVKKNPTLWVIILFVYAFMSVLPQELLYRSYFFNRYKDLFKNPKYLVIINIIAFPLAHLFLKNWLVLLITLIGGIFFALTYKRSKSIILTSLEHAIYGNWLFTIGMGEMLAFPMPS
jgi:membrane protease YdiL (CAAX protease family)